jgi:hypothetical protein
MAFFSNLVLLDTLAGKIEGIEIILYSLLLSKWYKWIICLHHERVHISYI